MLPMPNGTPRMKRWEIVGPGFNFRIATCRSWIPVAELVLPIFRLLALLRDGALSCSWRPETFYKLPRRERQGDRLRPEPADRGHVPETRRFRIRGRPHRLFLAALNKPESPELFRGTRCRAQGVSSHS